MDPALLQFETLRSFLYYGAIYGIVVAVATWIYRDAKARGSNRALLWFLATLVFTILPVLLYLYLHPGLGPAADADENHQRDEVGGERGDVGEHGEVNDVDKYDD